MDSGFCDRLHWANQLSFSGLPSLDGNTGRFGTSNEQQRVFGKNPIAIGRRGGFGFTTLQRDEFSVETRASAAIIEKMRGACTSARGNVRIYSRAFSPAKVQQRYKLGTVILKVTGGWGVRGGGPGEGEGDISRARPATLRPAAAPVRRIVAPDRNSIRARNFPRRQSTGRWGGKGGKGERGGGGERREERGKGRGRGGRKGGG